VPWRAGELAGEVRLNRIHLEEDVGKSIHFETCSGLDFNRAGTPLMEIVTEPDIHTPEEAVAYLEALIEILVAGGITDGNLEEGNVRCDLNVSVAPEGSSELGTKAEIKNMNTLRGVLLALRHEIARQIRVVEGGGVIVQETRRWDDVLGCTTSMRTKEDSHDYRYFPDPDLLPIVLSEADLDAWRKELPELPAARRDRFVSELGLPEYDAGVLVSEKAVGDYYEELVAMGISPKTASNWVMTEVLRARGESGLRLEDLPAASLAGLIRMLEQQKINRQQARQIFDLIPVEGGSPEEIAQKHGMSQVSDDGFIAALVEGVLTQHAGPVSDYLAGKQAAFQFLIGQAMRASKGSANPQVVREALTKRLESLKTESP